MILWRLDVNRPFKHLLYIRLIAGFIFLFFGIFHLFRSEQFIDVLHASNFPLIDFNVIFIPLVECLIAILFFFGLFTRIAAIMGCITMLIAFYATYLAITSIPDLLLHLIISVILFISCVYLLIRGAGPYSIDSHSK